MKHSDMPKLHDAGVITGGQRRKTAPPEPDGAFMLTELLVVIQPHEQGIQDFPNQPDVEVRLAAIRSNLANLLRTEGRSAEADALAK